MRPDEISFLTTMSHFGAIFFALAHKVPSINVAPQVVSLSRVPNISLTMFMANQSSLVRLSDFGLRLVKYDFTNILVS